jgi:benzodiazapine receptor
MTLRRQVVGLIAWLAACFAAAAVGGGASIQAGAFYTGLVRPDWAPPPSVFGPVWSVLYTMMGVAAWMVWRAGGFAAARGALLLFLVQLGFNALWTWLFFGWRQGGLAFAEIVFLWVLILATLVAFWRIRPWAGALILPYLAWVGFAAALNFALWQSNAGVLG